MFSTSALQKMKPLDGSKWKIQVLIIETVNSVNE